MYGTDSYNPTGRHRELAAEYRELAARHREAASALESFERAECAFFPGSTRASCPLLGALTGAEDASFGVRLVFREGTDLEAVYAHIRCHLAFARTQGRTTATHCPMFLPGVGIWRDEAGIFLRVDDEADVPLLRERVRAHIAH